MRRFIALLCIFAHLLAVFPAPAKAGVYLSSSNIEQQETSTLGLSAGAITTIGSMIGSGVAAFTSSLITNSVIGAINGNFDLGSILKSAAISGLTASLFSGVHFIKGAFGIPQMQSIFSGTFNLGKALVSASLHGAVGCVSGVMRGSGCGSGAAGAALGDLAGNFQTGNAIADFFVTSGFGGLGSTITGGDFTSGALTAGLGYLYNRTLLASRALDSKFTGPLANHKFNVVLRDNIDDFPPDIRANIGDPVYFEKYNQYGYVLEDLKSSGAVNDPNGFYPNDQSYLYPAVNDKVSSDALIGAPKNVGDLRIYNDVNPMNSSDQSQLILNENSLLRGYARDLSILQSSGYSVFPPYPSNSRTASCVLISCSWYNSNSAADRRIINSGDYLSQFITNPSSGYNTSTTPVPGGFDTSKFPIPPKPYVTPGVNIP